MNSDDIQTATPESVMRTMDGMRNPFIILIETDNGFLGDYDDAYNMADVLTNIAKRIRHDGHRSGLIRDPNGNAIGRYDWH